MGIVKNISFRGLAGNSLRPKTRGVPEVLVIRPRTRGTRIETFMVMRGYEAGDLVAINCMIYIPLGKVPSSAAVLKWVACVSNENTKGGSRRPKKWEQGERMPC